MSNEWSLLYHEVKPYAFQKSKALAKLFQRLWMRYVKRDHNGQANVLASLATSLTHPTDDYLTIHIIEIWVISPLSNTDEDDTLTCTVDL